MPKAKKKVAALEREKKELNRFKSNAALVNPLGNVDIAEGDIAALQGQFSAIWGTEERAGEISQSLTSGEEVERPTIGSQIGFPGTPSLDITLGGEDEEDVPTEDELTDFTEQYKAGQTT